MYKAQIIARSARGKQFQCRAAKGGADSVHVRFNLPYRCNFGQHIRIVGSAPSLGSWDLEHALPMVWSEGDVWTAEVDFSAEESVEVEYKYAVCDEDGRIAAAWKPGGNFLLTVPSSGDSAVKIKDAWDDAYREVQIETQRVGRVKARRRRKSASGSSGSEDEEAYAAVSNAANNALERLETAVNMSLSLMESNTDAASTELLAADRMVAAAAQRAAAIGKALNVMALPKEEDEKPDGKA